MKTLIIVFALVLAFAPAAYVRRERIAPARTVQVVKGSRDRTLHGKARRTARRAA